MIRARNKFWLEDGDNNYLMGPRTARLLQAIDDYGSLSKAAQSTGFSYRAAWNRLKRVEQALGFKLLERTVGGQGGGGSVLSVQGKQIVEVFFTLEQASKHILNDAVSEFNTNFPEERDES